MIRTLVINSGSTSTKLSYFEDDNRILDETINHDKKDVIKYSHVSHQLEYRYGLICEWHKENKIRIAEP